MKRKTLLFSILFSSVVFSQTVDERKKIMEYYKSLGEVTSFDRVNRTNEFLTTVERAKKIGVPLTLTDYDGVEGQLVRFDGDIPIYYRTYNAGSAVTTRANMLHPTAGNGYSLTGLGMLVGVWDQNHPRLSHLDFRKASGESKLLAVDGPTAPSAHSTHVTGTVLSTGVSSSNFSGRGIAYEADGWIFDWTNDITEMDMYAGFGLLISNHSYGLIASQLPQWYFGAYVTDSRDVDNVCFNKPKYLPVYAAGNDRGSASSLNPTKNGNDLLTGDKTSKNSLVIGAVNEVANYVDKTSVVMSGFSSFGPTDDFRIKPDLVAKGVDVFSTISNSDTSYGSLDGTSMAAPSVTASLALVQQYYGSPFLNAATLKGLALHTADEAGDATGPDQKFGWGLLNTFKMVKALDDNGELSIVEEKTLNSGQTYTINVLALGTEPLKASISWTDRPGTEIINSTDNSSPRLVNDLDLRIVQNSTQNLPWALSKNWQNLVAQKADNNVDPFERVDIDNPSGVYQIVVSHKGTLVGGSQNYSLVITGVDADAVLSIDETQDNGQTNLLWVNKNTLNFNLASEFDNGQLEIFDVQGALVFKSVLDNNQGGFDLSHLSKGFYFVKINSNSGLSFTQKIIF